jgi:hypothetical protein
MTVIPNIDAGLPVLNAARLPDSRRPRAARRHARRVERRRFVRMEQHAAAVEHLRPLPGRGESIHGLMNGSYSGWSLATAVIELLGVPVDELIVSTLGFNRQNCRSLVALLDSGAVGSLLLNVSNYFRHSRSIFGDIRRELESRGQRIAVTRSHAKLLLFRARQRAIVIETSANLRSSQNWEQFVISDDAELLRFHRRWILDLIRETEACQPNA